jgi:hypothetical protein
MHGARKEKRVERSFGSNLRGLKRAACVLAAVLAPSAFADLPDVIFSIEASGANGTGLYEVTLDDAGWDRSGSEWQYSNDQKITITDPDTGNVVFSVSGVEVYFRADPQINIAFAVQASNVDTAFVITSNTLNFPVINDADGQASSAFTVTDTNNDGASLSGDGAGGSSYLAMYNGTNLFSGQITSISVPAGSQSNSTAENDPAVGYRAVGADVTNMTAEIAFTLSARDLASGTTTYEIIPEPSALALLALGALSLFRRK